MMTAPSYYAIVWRNPPDLATRDVVSFPSRADRDAFVRTPSTGPEFRLAVSSGEARSVKGSRSPRSNQLTQTGPPVARPGDS